MTVVLSPIVISCDKKQTWCTELHIQVIMNTIKHLSHPQLQVEEQFVNLYWQGRSKQFLYDLTSYHLTNVTRRQWQWTSIKAIFISYSVPWPCSQISTLSLVMLQLVCFNLIYKVYFINNKIKMDIPHISLMVDYLPSLQLKSVFSQEESFDALTASTFSNVNPPLWMVFSGNVIRPDFY